MPPGLTEPVSPAPILTAATEKDLVSGSLLARRRGLATCLESMVGEGVACLFVARRTRELKLELKLCGFNWMRRDREGKGTVFKYLVTRCCL